jgi:CheY-like chemotaxis protein
MLTARGDDVDRIVGLELGADDYLSKPFNPRELVARIRAILRRASNRPARGGAPTNSRRADRAAHRHASGARRGAPVALTGAEFRVLELLMRSAGQVISRESMTEQALGRKLVPYDRSIDTHISNLRRKLDLEAGKNPEIKNVRGSGYTLTCALMHSLFLRIFVLFWIAMALIVGGSIAITFTVAAREYESPEFQRRPNVAIQASEVLAKGGIGALEALAARPTRTAWPTATVHHRPGRRDILGRRFRERRRGAWNSSINPNGRPSMAPPGRRANFRPQRARSQIVAPDGTAYTVLLVPRRPSIFGALSLPGSRLTILGIALVVSAIHQLVAGAAS